MPESYDVVVVGGGIHGVGVAQAAAAAGYSVAVLEQRSLAWGTSSRSSKLIHGGLRYLESYQFSVVRECLAERSLLLKLAPELVKLVPFFIPVYQHTRRRPWQIRAGLSIYGALTGFNPGARFRKVPTTEWDSLDGLTPEHLQAVFQYWDGQTDDAMLTRAVMASAEQLGAELYQPAEVQHIALKSDGATVTCLHDGVSRDIECGVVVNAAGPWVNELLDKVQPKADQLSVDLVQGTHLIIEGEVKQGIYYMESPEDQRVIFVIPWKGKMMIGTTEHQYQGAPESVAPLDEERRYLLETLKHYFPRYRDPAQLKVVDCFAGLRVLPRAEGAAFSRSRETVIHGNGQPPRLFSIYGGKLTAYRATAERVVAQFESVLPRRRVRASTRTLKLTPP